MLKTIHSYFYLTNQTIKVFFVSKMVYSKWCFWDPHSCHLVAPQLPQVQKALFPNDRTRKKKKKNGWIGTVCPLPNDISPEATHITLLVFRFRNSVDGK